jgi:hypothetical protein
LDSCGLREVPIARLCDYSNKIGFHEMRGISGPGNRLSDSQGLCDMELLGLQSFSHKRLVIMTEVFLTNAGGRRKILKQAKIISHNNMYFALNYITPLS